MRTLALWGVLVLAACGNATVLNDERPDAPDAPDAPGVDADDEDAPAPLHVTAMSFNLRTYWGNDGVNAWEFRLPLALRLIGDAAPDVLGTQEAVYVQVDDLAAGLPGYDHVGRIRSNSPLDEACTIFYRADRFERIADDSFQLSDTPDVIESTFSANQSRPRIVTWIRLRERSSGREFVAFNTHFDTSSADDIPVRSAALTVTKMARIRAGLPAFLSGDFNTTPDSDAWAVLTGKKAYEGVTGDLVDPWVERGLPEQGTSSGFSDTATRRIDNVFHVPGVRAVDARVVRLHEGEVFASDHFQVVVEMEF